MSTDALVCKICGGIFHKPPGRGRPPSKCTACIDSPTVKEEPVKIDPKERVDRLEIMLKSRGNHISQNRGEFD